MKHTPKRRPGRAPGCAETVCRPTLAHGNCVFCGALCDGRTVSIEPETLRRRMVFCCSPCLFSGRANGPEQQRLREERSRRDWKLATDPHDASRVELGTLPEQIPSEVRKAIRVFHDSPEPSAVLFGITVTTANQSIESLGLHAQMFAETRSGQTVIRKSPHSSESLIA